MHKYQPDGALGSSWHPYTHNGISSPPIQEDETAIVLFMFAQYYQLHKDEKLLREFYQSLISPMANFLASYVQNNLLPKPSYDLWEEVFLTSTYTTAVSYAALSAAAALAEDIGSAEDSLRWKNVAEDMQRAAHASLVEDGILIKGILPNGEKDTTLDASSFYGAFMFGLLDSESDVLAKTAEAIERRLSSGGGIVRYENDDYNRLDDSSIGNPWFITSLWLAEFYTERNNREKSSAIIDWTKNHILSTGVLSEQIDPVSGNSLSVAPLTWSQAEYVSCLLDSIPNQTEGYGQQ